MEIYVSKPDQHTSRRLLQKERESNRVTSGTLLLFSFNLREPIWNVSETISTDIDFISDQSFFLTHHPGDGSNIDVEIFKNRFGQGDICCVSILEGEIIAYCWIASKRAYIGEIDRSMQLRDGEIYLYDAFTNPEFRGRNLFPGILTRILHYARQRGYHRGLIFTLSSNSSSIKAIKKAGFHKFQSVSFENISEKTLCTFSMVRKGDVSIEERLFTAENPGS